MMMMMMMIIMMNYLCGMVDRRKAFNCQKSSLSRIYVTRRAGFKLAQDPSSGLVEWSCAVVIITIPRGQVIFENSTFKKIYLKHIIFVGVICFKILLVVVHSLKYCVILFEENSCSQSLTFANLLASLGGSAWVIHLFK